ncbi:hypothetical protein [Ruegeria sp. EL01]|uniref:hypothetical protein n=1 Tax=Ruegeria sp. EL01 TaxID=2107578 RepID=UPI000EA8304F|nr:hypothetical protein [Ruegeria sp. EL01]
MQDNNPYPYPFDQSLIWHVVFHPGKRFWSRRFCHVSLAGYSNDTWLHLDLQRHGVNAASIYHYDEVQAYLDFLLTHYTVVKFGPAHPASSTAFLGPMTCVNFVKHMLRLRSSALRPDGLFRDLLRIEGTEILNEAAETTEGRGNP